MDNNKCPICGSKNFFHDIKRAEIICRNCGAIIFNNVFDFYEHSRNSYKSSNLSKLDKFKAKTGRNKRISYYTSGERSLFEGLREVNRISSNLNIIRNIRNYANYIYKKAWRNNFIRGRSIEVVAAASVYLSCRVNNVPRTLEEIEIVSVVTKKEIRRVYLFLANKLNIKLTPISPTDLVPRFATKLELSNKVQVKAIELINIATANGLTSGRDPKAITAAILYIASLMCNEKKTQKEIMVVTGVSDVSIRARYKELVDKFNLEISI